MNPCTFPTLGEQGVHIVEMPGLIRLTQLHMNKIGIQNPKRPSNPGINIQLRANGTIVIKPGLSDFKPIKSIDSSLTLGLSLLYRSP